MKLHHKSHHIFTLLGALVLIFIVFFGIRYFQAEYNFQDIQLTNNAQSYDEGIDTSNPFLPHPDESSSALIEKFSWVTFGGNGFSFAYPDQYALRIVNGKHIDVLPPLSAQNPVDCSIYTDEQERALCERPHMSPHITIQADVDENDFPPGLSADTLQVVSVDGVRLEKNHYADEYGGTTVYRMNDEGRIVQVSYRYADVQGGTSFATLNERYGNQYQLNSRDQDKLALALLNTITLK